MLRCAPRFVLGRSPAAGLAACACALLLAACSARPAVPPVQRAPATAPSGAPIAMLVLGDSLGLGLGARDPRNALGFRIYRSIERGHPGSEVTNLSIGGTRTVDVLRLEIPRLPRTADLVLLIAGGNDVVRGTPPSAFARDYARTLAALRTRYPHAAIVATGIPDVGASPLFASEASRTTARARTLDRIVRIAARRARVAFVDLFRASQRARSDPAFLSDDDFHPSDLGYAALADVALPTVRRALSSSERKLGRSGFPPGDDAETGARSLVRTQRRPHVHTP